MVTDMNTGRVMTINRKGNTKTLPTLIVSTPHGMEPKVLIMKLLRPKDTRGGIIRSGEVCLWYTPIETLFEKGGDYTHVLNFTHPYHADSIGLWPPANADLEE